MKFLKFFYVIPLIFINTYPVYGVIKLGWLVSDIFFWFYFDFVFTFIIVYLMLSKYWENIDFQLARRQKKEYIFSSFYVFIFASIFLLLPIKTQMPLHGSFWNFISDKILAMLMVIFVGLLDLFFNYKRNRIYLEKNFKEISMPMIKKYWAIAGLYGILMMEYHLSGSNDISLSKNYLILMLVCLMIGKTIADFFAFLKQRTKPTLINN